MLHTDVCLEALAYELPPYVVSSESIFERLSPMLSRLKIPVESIQVTSGVEEIRFWDEGDTIVSTATRAARKAIEKSGIDLNDIGLIVSTSVSKDYIEPSMASLVHGELGLPETCKNFDVGSACLGFFNGVSIVADYISMGRIKAALIVDSESSREIVESTINSLLKPETTVADFQVNFAALTLGSGAVAVVITHRSVSKSPHMIRGHVTLADTVHRHLCLGNRTEMLVQSRQLYEAGLDVYRRTWELSKEIFQWDVDTIDMFICHQVAARHHQGLFDQIGVPPEKTFATFPFLGNAGPASVPLTTALALDAGKIKSGDRLCWLGIGSGLNCSIMDLVW